MSMTMSTNHAYWSCHTSTKISNGFILKDQIQLFPGKHVTLLSSGKYTSCVRALVKDSVTEVKKSSSEMQYWASISDEIEAYLKQAITIREPVVVFEPMRHLTFSGPRSMAPALCIAACELVGGDRAQAVHAASALHVMYAAMQTHDYLPLTDQPRPKTRSRPINHVFRPNIELQTGDGLVSFGYELMSRVNDAENPDYSGRVLRAIVEVARLMGSEGIVKGQFKEVECGQLDGKACEEGWLRYVYEKKEGAFHACGAACGALLGHGSEEEIERLRKYGLYVGMIQGILHGVGHKEHELNDSMVQGLRNLALKELEAFSPSKIAPISSFVVSNN